MKKIIISLITVLLIVVGVLGFRTYVQNREKDNSIVKIGKKNMRIIMKKKVKLKKLSIHW